MCGPEAGRMHAPQHLPRPARPASRRLQIAIGSILALLVAGLLAQPAAAADLSPSGEQNRRAVYAGLFAMAAETHGALPGNSSSRRVPASSFSVVGAALAQAYEDAPWLDPDDAAAVFGKALEASSCAKPCVPVEQSATQLLRRAESWVRDPALVPAEQREVAFVYSNAIAAVAEELGGAASSDPLKDPILALPPEQVGKRLAACAASDAACGDATDKLFASYLQGTSVDATPAQLNQTVAIKGGRIGIEFEDGVILGGDELEGDPIEIQIKRQPVKLDDDGQLAFDAGAIQPTVTPLEQVPAAAAQRLVERLAEERDCPPESRPCVSDAELLAAQKAALGEWYTRALDLVTADPADPGRQLVLSDALGWLRQLALLDGDDEQGPLWDEFRDEADKLQAAVKTAVEAAAATAHERCVNGEPGQVTPLLEAARTAQLLGSSVPDEDARIAACVATLDKPIELAKVVAAAQLSAANTVTAQATASLAALADGVSGTRRLEKNAAFWKAGEDERKALLASITATNATLDQSAALAGMAADFIAVSGDPKLAKQVRTVTKATLDIAKAATGTVAGIVQLGTQLATGNFIGAAISSVSLIQDVAKAAGILNGLFTGDTAEPEKSPDELLSDQISQLSDQVADLGETMEQRFDVVDKRLKAIYTDMSAGFANLEARIAEIGRKVDVIGATVDRIERKLDQFERNMYQLAAEGVEGELWNAINEGVGSGIAMDAGDFNRVSSVLFTHATLRSMHLSAFDDTGPSAEEPIAARLAGIAGDDGSGALERNINYLGALARTGAAPVGPFGSWGDGLPRLPNFRDWALASKAYARMVMEQPRHATTATVLSRLGALEAKGAELKDSIAALSADGVLFDDLIGLHDSRAQKFLADLKTARDAWLTQRGLDTETLYGGPERRVPMDDAGLKTGCDVQVPRPASLDVAAMFKPQYSLVQRLGTPAGSVRLCASAAYVGAHECGFGTPRPRCGRLSIAFTAQYQQPGGAWTDLRRAHWTDTRDVQFCGGPPGEYRVLGSQRDPAPDVERLQGQVDPDLRSGARHGHRRRSRDHERPRRDRRRPARPRRRHAREGRHGRRPPRGR